MSKPTVTCDELETWRQTRLATVSSLRQLAKYVDNVSQFSSILVTFREAVFSQGATLLAGAVTVTAGVVLLQVACVLKSKQGFFAASGIEGLF